MPDGCPDWAWLNKMVKKLFIVISLPRATAHPRFWSMYFLNFPTDHIILSQFIYDRFIYDRSTTESPALLKGQPQVTPQYYHEWCQICGHSFFCGALVQTHPHIGNHASWILSSKRYCWFYMKCVFWWCLFSTYFASKYTSGHQYRASLATASTTWRVARCLVRTHCQSWVYEEIFNTFWGSESNYLWWIKHHVQTFQASQSNLVASGGVSQKVRARMICHHQWNVLFFSSTVTIQQAILLRSINWSTDFHVKQQLRISPFYEILF